MSSVKLTTTGGSGGTIELNAPANTTGNAAVQLTLPVNDGDANQYLKTDGSGALSWATVTDTDTDTLSFRRINHNGDCSVAQRGTVTSLTSGYGGPDRYKLYSSSHGTYTASQELDAPDGFDQSLKILNTSADTSIASSARLYIQHKIEKYDLIRTKKGTSGALSLTAQFWVKSDKTGTYIFEMWDNQNNRHISSTYTISSANTWEKKTMTFAGDTSGNTFVAGTASGIDCNWWLAAGSNFTSGSLASSWTANTDANRAVGQTVNIGDSGNWYMTGFQLETGSTASDYEYRSFSDELRSCQRYFCKTYGHDDAPGTDTWRNMHSIQSDAGSNSYAGPGIWYYPGGEMRAIPTVTLYAKDGTEGKIMIDTTEGNGSMPAANQGTKGLVAYRNNDSGGSTGAGNSISLHCKADAEL